MSIEDRIFNYFMLPVLAGCLLVAGFDVLEFWQGYMDIRDDLFFQCLVDGKKEYQCFHLKIGFIKL